MPHDVMEACIHNNHLTIDDIYTCNKVHLSDMLILLCEWQRTTMDGWSEYGSIVIVLVLVHYTSSRLPVVGILLTQIVISKIIYDYCPSSSHIC